MVFSMTRLMACLPIRWSSIVLGACLIKLLTSLSLLGLPLYCIQIHSLLYKLLHICLCDMPRSAILNSRLWLFGVVQNPSGDIYFYKYYVFNQVVVSNLKSSLFGTLSAFFVLLFKETRFCYLYDLNDKVFLLSTIHELVSFYC
jgi:hypothetical protein